MLSGSSAIEEQSGSTSEGTHNRYLSFIVGEQEYCLDLHRVQEIRKWGSATTVPSIGEHIDGLMNLRGAIIPILDLRRRLGTGSTAFSSTTVVIIVSHDNEEKRAAFIVDAVADVMDATDENLHPVPDFAGTRLEFVKGVVTLNENMIILLNIDGLLNLSADKHAPE